MLDTLGHIKVGDVEYPIAFTLNVMAAIQEKYGSMKAWGEILQPARPTSSPAGTIKAATGDVSKELPETAAAPFVDNEPRIKDLIWTFTQFINEGIDIENEEAEVKRQPLTEKQVGRLISSVGIKEITAIVQNLTVESTKTDDPNSQTVQNQTNQINQ